MESSDSTVSHHRQQLRPPLLNQGLNPTSWSPSETSQSAFPISYPPIIPGFPLQVYPRAGSVVPPTTDPLQNCTNNQGSQAPHCPSPMGAATYTAPMVPPFVALLLPNYVYPPMSTGLPQLQPMYHGEPPGFTHQNYSVASLPSHVPFLPQPYFNYLNTQCTPQARHPAPSGYFSPSPQIPKAATEAQSRSSTPQSGGCGGPASPPLFQSRCSSPLNLVELELSVDRQDSTALPSGGQGSSMAEWEKSAGAIQVKERELKQVTIEILGLAFFAFPLNRPSDSPTCKHIIC